MSRVVYFSIIISGILVGLFGEFLDENAIIDVRFIKKLAKMLAL